MTQKIDLILIIIGLFFTLISCDSTHKKLSHKQTVENFYYGLNNGDFSVVSKCIFDSVTTTEMEYILTQNLDEFYKHFQWDSVFKPKYELTDLEMIGDSVKVTVSKTCKRIEFLQDSALIYKTLFVFEDNKISMMHTTEYVFNDFEKWQARRDKLMEWTNKNHAELSGFLYDLSLKGAQEYLKAIDLYRDEK